MRANENPEFLKYVFVDSHGEVTVLDKSDVSPTTRDRIYRSSAVIAVFNQGRVEVEKNRFGQRLNLPAITFSGNNIENCPNRHMHTKSLIRTVDQLTNESAVDSIEMHHESCPMPKAASLIEVKSIDFVPSSKV